MKRILNSLGIGLMLFVGMVVSKPADAQPRIGVSINFQTFYDQLSPYGDWIDYPEYGYTWRPRVHDDFRPYSTNGSWVYTNDNDWMWNSGYDWGWAPFHYGRWFYDDFYGWLWVPGYDWSPAWVSWRGGGDYYGWAPIRPGININIGFGGYNPPYDYWTFAPCRYMSSPYISRYYYPYHNNVTIFNHTTIINNYYGNRGYNDRGGRSSYYSNGPRRTDVERYTGRVNAVSIRNADRPGRTEMRRNSMSVYRPTVSRSGRDVNQAPRTVERYDGNNIASRNSVRRNNNEVQGRTNDNRNERFNTAPRREDAIGRNERGDNVTTRQNRDEQVQQRSNEMRKRSEEVESRQRQMMEGRQQQRNTEMQQQRSNEMRKRSEEVESRQRQMMEGRQQQRNMEMQQQRSNEMRQRNEEVESRQKQMMESRQQQRNTEMQQQRSNEMRQRNEEAQSRQRQMMESRQQQQRSSEARPQRDFQIQRSAPSPAPQVESRGRGNFERGSGRRGE